MCIKSSTLVNFKWLMSFFIINTILINSICTITDSCNNMILLFVIEVKDECIIR